MSGPDFIITLAVGLGPYAAIYIWRRADTWSRAVRYNELEEMKKPDFCQKKRQRMRIYLSMAVYFAGAYMVLSASENPRMVIAKAAMGIAVAVCGGLAGRNAMVSNEYGMEERKKQFSAIQEKEDRKISTNGLESLVVSVDWQHPFGGLDIS